MKESPRRRRARAIRLVFGGLGLALVAGYAIVRPEPASSPIPEAVVGGLGVLILTGLAYAVPFALLMTGRPRDPWIASITGILLVTNVLAWFLAFDARGMPITGFRSVGPVVIGLVIILVGRETDRALDRRRRRAHRGRRQDAPTAEGPRGSPRERSTSRDERSKGERERRRRSSRSSSGSRTRRGGGSSSSRTGGSSSGRRRSSSGGTRDR